jgi:hypothetical protein
MPTATEPEVLEILRQAKLLARRYEKQSACREMPAENGSILHPSAWQSTRG